MTAPSPVVRILAIGDELILGRTVDTNSTFLCRLLGEAGCVVRGVHQVGDAQADLEAAIARCLEDATLVICTGGLGPTDDDRTRFALARVLGLELKSHAPSWRFLERFYRRNGRGTPPESNRQQVLIPQGGEPLANDRGTAPGILVQATSGAWIACLPGVPHEMKAMAGRLVGRLPDLMQGLRVPTVAELWFSGLPESAAQERIAGLLTEADPQVGITVSELGHITLRVIGRPTQVRCRIRQLRDRLEPWLLPAPGLAPSLVQELTRRRWTVTAAESCSGGHIAAQLTAIPGASAVLRESLVVYAESAKAERLGVPAKVLRNVVSEACVRAMAEGARQRTGADLALATSGIAGPAGGTRNTPVGTVWIAVATAEGTVSRRVHIPGERTRVQARAAAAAYQLAWEGLTGRVEWGAVV